MGANSAVPHRLAARDVFIRLGAYSWGPTVWAATISMHQIWTGPNDHWTGGPQLGAYNLGSYSLKAPDLELSKYSFDRGPTIGADSLKGPDLEPSNYSFC